MDITLIDQIITQIGFYFNAILIPLATIIIGFKLVREKKSNGKYNPIRSLIFAVFFCFSLLGIFEFLVNLFPLNLGLLSAWFGGGVENFDFYGFLVGSMVTIGVTIIFYAYRWESLYYFMFFIYGGMVIFYLLTGFDAWLEIYITICGLLSVIFLYFTGVKLKDNGALGLAIFFTIAFVTIAIDFGSEFLNHWITQISILIYSVFILIFSLGLFRPFKQREEVIK